MAGVKLSDLLPDNLERAGETGIEKLRARDDIGSLNVAWNLVGGQLEGALHNALDCDVVEVAAECWAKANLLAEYADPERHPPGERSVIEIGGRDLTRELDPVIVVNVAGCPPFELRFTVALTLHYGGVKLVISDGRIREGSLGDAWVSAQLRYGEIPLQSLAESKKLPLSGPFMLPGDGVKIPRLH